MGYNMLTCGMIPNDPTKAQFNSNLLHKVTNDATIGLYPDTIDFPPVKDAYYLQNGMNEIGTAGAVYRGFTGMGAGNRSAPASRIVGMGRGKTLKVSKTGMGCIIEGLSVHSNYTKDSSGNFVRDQSGDDALIWIEGTQTTVRNVYLGDGLTSLRVERELDYPGEFWFENIEIEGNLGYAAGIYNAGDSTVELTRVITYNTNPVQPQYGHKFVCSGEVQMDKCDTVNCGNCLAFVPGMDGALNQYIKCAFISKCLFDSGNKQSCFLLMPQNGGFLANIGVDNSWSSSPGNFNGTAPTNGVHIDGSLSKPKYMASIKDVRFNNYINKSFRNRYGWYGRNVIGWKILGSSVGDCFDGIHVGPGCPGLIVAHNSIGDIAPASGAPGGNNKNCGILIEPTTDSFLIDANMCLGNNVAGIYNINPPRPNQIITPYNVIG